MSGRMLQLPIKRFATATRFATLLHPLHYFLVQTRASKLKANHCRECATALRSQFLKVSHSCALNQFYVTDASSYCQSPESHRNSPVVQPAIQLRQSLRRITRHDHPLKVPRGKSLWRPGSALRH